MDGVTFAADGVMATISGSAMGAVSAAVVDVCVCTFQRSTLWQTMQSLAAQRGAPPFRVIVADNDETPSARDMAGRARTDLGLDVHYLHAPARNISIARNACLEAATAGLVAFIDDDEIAPVGWLAALNASMQAQGLDIVFGPVRAQYSQGTPKWVVRGDFHSFGPVVRPNGQIETGYSSNVLFRRAAIGELRFDPRLGRTGGEDTLFFSRLNAAGARLGYCPEAAVYEPTPLARANLRWLVRRAFRSGQTHARVLRDRGEGRLSMVALATAKAAYCGLAAAATIWSPVRVRRNIVRAALHAGVVAKALGADDLELYGASA